MKLINAIAAGALLAAAQFALPAFAQSTASVASTVAACKSGASCVAAVQAYVDALKAQGLTAAQIDASIASLSTELGQQVVNGGLQPNVVREISAGIRTAAAEISDEGQRRETLQVASNVENLSETTAADGEAGAPASP
ncbi:hypothetical protein [Cohaesibacter celericrescens]|uniref:Uncharacterized protein n=1 Tax=Cohaesibacter celericrescens TaxID=2067669 RepID=A0A2N5XNF1_9HYPH|nr:hypothetical protein [Cohaesibacter celericrescens]PLW76049.1 hypothetical protein C0081_16640 [Cohaesibacter celericrescens]